MAVAEYNVCPKREPLPSVGQSFKLAVTEYNVCPRREHFYLLVKASNWMLQNMFVQKGNLYHLLVKASSWLLQNIMFVPEGSLCHLLVKASNRLLQDIMFVQKGSFKPSISCSWISDPVDLLYVKKHADSIQDTLSVKFPSCSCSLWENISLLCFMLENWHIICRG